MNIAVCHIAPSKFHRAIAIVNGVAMSLGCFSSQQDATKHAEAWNKALAGAPQAPIGAVMVATSALHQAPGRPPQVGYGKKRPTRPYADRSYLDSAIDHLAVGGWFYVNTQKEAFAAYARSKRIGRKTSQRREMVDGQSKLRITRVA